MPKAERIEHSNDTRRVQRSLHGLQPRGRVSLRRPVSKRRHRAGRRSMVDVPLFRRQVPIIFIRDLVQPQSRSSLVQPQVIANGFWRDLVRVSTKLINLSLSDPEERITQFLTMFLINLETYRMEIQEVLLKIIAFLYFQRHQRTAELTMFKTEHFLVAIQNLATNSKDEPI